MADPSNKLIGVVFALFIEHKRFKTVAEHLNAEGYRTSNDALFTGQTVSRILQDQQHLENGTVTQELWDQVQEIIAANKRRGKTRRVAHLCAGFLKCDCGKSMYVPTNSKKYVCANCRKKIPKDDLEAIIVDKLREEGADDIRAVAELWPTLSFEQKRELVESAIEEIRFDGKRISISLYTFG